MTAMLGVALNLILGLSRAGDGWPCLARREECYCPLVALSGQLDGRSLGQQLTLTGHSRSASTKNFVERRTRTSCSHSATS